MSNLPVFVLCGGRGTRLREETEFRPKPMVMIGDRPILWHIMKIFDHYGHRNFVLCLGYRADLIRDYFLRYHTETRNSRISLRTGTFRRLGGSGEIEDWEIDLLDTGLDTQTGARVKKALKLIDADRFLLTYGDGVGDVDISALLAHHEKMGLLATITAVRPSSRFGELDLEGDRVTTFVEKPQTGAGWINGGFMVFERKAFDVLDDGRDEPLETSVLQELSRRGQLSVYRHDRFWQCMDTYREMQLLNEIWSTRQPGWQIWDKLDVHSD